MDQLWVSILQRCPSLRCPFRESTVLFKLLKDTMNSLRPCPHKSGNFEDAYVLLPTLVWIGCLKPFWRAVLKDVVLVSGFTDFVSMKGRLM